MYILQYKHSSARELDTILCIRNISITYFTENVPLVLSLPSSDEEVHIPRTDFNQDISESNANFIDSLGKEIQNTGIPTMITKISSLADISSLSRTEARKHGSYIIVINGKTRKLQSILSARIELLNSLPSWNPRAMFVVVVFAEDRYSSKQLAKELLSELWEWKIANVLILLPVSNSGDKPSEIIEIYTWFPYEGAKDCTVISEAVLITHWSIKLHKGFSTNTHLFPRRDWKNLHGCPILTTTFPLAIATGKMQLAEEESKSTKITYSQGMEVQLLSMVADKLNSSLQYLQPPPNDEKWGTLGDSGEFTGLLGDLIYNRADIGFVAWPLHPNLVMVLDPTITYQRDSWIWWVPCAKKVPRWKSLFKVFSVELWIAGIAGVFLSPIVLIFLSKISYRISGVSESRYYQGFSTCLSSILALVLGISAPHLPKSHSLRVFFIFWICFSFALSTIFQTFFFTFLMKPELQNQMNNFEEILSSGVSYGYNPLIDEIVSVSEPTVRENRISCPESNIPPCLDWVANHDNFSILCSSVFMEYQLTTSFLDENGKPLICEAGDSFYTIYYATYMKKGNPLLDEFNRILLACDEAGFLQYIFKRLTELRYIEAAVQGIKVIGEEYGDLTLDQLQGAFILYVCGISLSSLAFVCEKMLRVMKIV